MGDSSICVLGKILIESSLTLSKLRAISVLEKTGGEKAVFSIRREYFFSTHPSNLMGTSRGIQRER